MKKWHAYGLNLTWQHEFTKFDLLKRSFTTKWNKFKNLKTCSFQEHNIFKSTPISKLSECLKIKSESRSVMSDSLRPHGLQPTSFLCPWDFPGKNTGVSFHLSLHEDKCGSEYNIFFLKLSPLNFFISC